MIPPHKPQRRIWVAAPLWRIAFCLTPRAGSNAVLDAIGRAHGIAGLRTWGEHNPLAALTLDEVNRFVPHWPRVMLLRNPFDRLVAVYEYHVVANRIQTSFTLRALGFRSDDTFARFLDRALADPEADEHLGLQSWQCDTVCEYLRFERLADDWRGIEGRIGETLPALDRVNAVEGTRRPFLDYYDDEQRRRVERVYSLDLVQWGYSFR